MLPVVFLLWAVLCVSHPVEKYDKMHPHPPVFDGTDKTVPTNLKDNSIVDNIEEINKESGEEDKLFETDIMLTPHDHDRVDTSPTGHEHGADVDVDSIQGQKRKAIRTRRKLWPSRIVPVEITPAAYDARKNILAAMTEIQKVSCVRFKDKDAGDKHWIQIDKRNGCWSRVGREYNIPGAQPLSLGKGCNTKGIILHELMHALGFWHEQSRTDRDKYIAVLWENIKPGNEREFNKYPTEEVDYAGGMYDFESIMHYGNYLLSKNRKMTMVALKNPRLTFGHKLRLSKTDIMQLNTIYDCKTPRGGWSSWTDWGPCDRSCTMMRERFCAARDRRKCPGVDPDGLQSQKTRCDTAECNVPLNGHWGRWSAWSTCSKTCDKGYQTRSRNCEDPPPQFNGNICEGALVEVQMCKGKRPTCTRSHRRSRTKKDEQETHNKNKAKGKIDPFNG